MTTDGSPLEYIEKRDQQEDLLTLLAASCRSLQTKRPDARVFNGSNALRFEINKALQDNALVCFLQFQFNNFNSSELPLSNLCLCRI